VLLAVVGGPIPAYLNWAGIAAMPQTLPQTVARPRVSVALVLASALVTVALVGTGLLWAHYGTAVFFETIRAGFSACFG
jgi:hypothetical protein